MRTSSFAYFFFGAPGSSPPRGRCWWSRCSSRWRRSRSRWRLGVFFIIQKRNIWETIFIYLFFWGALFPRTADPFPNLYAFTLSHCTVMSQDPSSRSRYPSSLRGIWSRSSQQSVFGSANATDWATGEGLQYLIMARLIYLRTDAADPEARCARARVGPSPGTNFIKIVVITTLWKSFTPLWKKFTRLWFSPVVITMLWLQWEMSVLLWNLNFKKAYEIREIQHFTTKLTFPVVITPLLLQREEITTLCFFYTLWSKNFTTLKLQRSLWNLYLDAHSASV